MRIGTLNRRVLLQRLVETPTGTGGTTQAWVDIAQVWAHLRHQSGMEVVRSAAVPVSVVKASIRIRFREDIDATCRALYGGTIYSILAVIHDSVGREYVDLVCETGQNNG